MKSISILVLGSLLAGNVLAAAPFQLDYIGQNIVSTGTTALGTTVGGLSGIDFDAGTNSYYAISDDRSALNPARFYNLSLNLTQFNRSLVPGSAGVTFNAVTTMLTPGGLPFPTNAVDPEALRVRSGQVFWSSEGERLAGNLQDPFVREMNLDGSYVRDFSVPSHYDPAGAGATDPGIRRNLAFESLTFSNDGATLYTATENALTQDGPAATVLDQSPSRVLAFDTPTGSVIGEYVYLTDAVVTPPIPANNFATNGLVELLNVPGMDDVFIAVERAFSAGIPGTGNAIRLYLAMFDGATNVAGIDDLDAAGAYTPMAKTLLLDLTNLTNDNGSSVALDNIEGITWGPAFNGAPTLILVSDNNFSGTQFTQFMAFTVQPVPLPAALPLMASALGLVLMRRR